MKKIILLTAAVVSLSNFAFAQAAQKAPNATHSSAMQMAPEQRAKIMTNKMQEKLNLTKSQHASIYNINLEVANKMTKARANHDRTAAEAIRKYRTNEYKKVLTSQQMATLDQAIATRRGGNRQAK